MLGVTYIPDAAQGRNKSDQPSGSNTLDGYGVGLAYSGQMDRLMLTTSVGLSVTR